MDSGVCETTNPKTSLNKLQYNDISIKQIISFKNMSSGQIQDILLLKDWEYVSTKNHGGIVKRKVTIYESSSGYSTLTIIDSGRKSITLQTRDKELNKSLIRELYSNNYKISQDYNSKINLSTPEVGKFYGTLETGKIYSNGTQQVSYNIIMFSKVTNVINDKKGTYYIDKNSTYTGYEFQPY